MPGCPSKRLCPVDLARVLVVEPKAASRQLAGRLKEGKNGAPDLGGPGAQAHQEPMRPPFLRRRTIVQSRGIVTPSVGAGKFVKAGLPSPGCCMLMNAVR